MDAPKAPLPRRVGSKGQVQIPPELMVELGIVSGEYVWIGRSPERPGTLILIPGDLHDEIYRKGYTALS